MEITKKQIADLEVGQSVSGAGASDRLYMQRLRNYAHSLRNDTRVYTVKKNADTVTVTRLKEPAGLTARLRSMQPGEVCYPCEVNHSPFVRQTVAQLRDEAQFRVTRVVRVERLK